MLSTSEEKRQKYKRRNVHQRLCSIQGCLEEADECAQNRPRTIFGWLNLRLKTQLGRSDLNLSVSPDQCHQLFVVFPLPEGVARKVHQPAGWSRWQNVLLLPVVYQKVFTSTCAFWLFE